MKEIFAFLSVDTLYLNYQRKYNEGYRVRNFYIHSLENDSDSINNVFSALLGCTLWSRTRKKLSGWNSGKPFPIRPNLQEKLWDVLEEDVDLLERITGLDCNVWRNCRDNRKVENN